MLIAAKLKIRGPQKGHGRVLEGRNQKTQICHLPISMTWGKVLVLVFSSVVTKERKMPKESASSQS